MPEWTLAPNQSTWEYRDTDSNELLETLEAKGTNYVDGAGRDRGRNFKKATEQIAREYARP